jgi:hypothetical protein
MAVRREIDSKESSAAIETLASSIYAFLRTVVEGMTWMFGGEVWNEPLRSGLPAGVTFKRAGCLPYLRNRPHSNRRWHLAPSAHDES